MEPKQTVDALIRGIRSEMPEERTAAWTSAGSVGPAALAPLAETMASGTLEVSRAACHAMWKITRQAGAPGASHRGQTVAQLAQLLDSSRPMDVRREVVWMLSEIGDEQAVPAVARLLESKPLREDARMVLERIPGQAALDALRAAFQTVPEDFRYHLAQSLRKRGVSVQGYPCQKLIPTRSTGIPSP